MLRSISPCCPCEFDEEGIQIQKTYQLNVGEKGNTTKGFLGVTAGGRSEDKFLISGLFTDHLARSIQGI